jgi:hypothetical protein
VDSAGDVYTTGWFHGTADFDPGPGTYDLGPGGGFVSKLDSDGNFVWAKRMGGGWSAIVVDSSGNVYTTGNFSGTADFDPGAGTYDLTSAGGRDICVSKLDSSGNFVWAKRMGGASDDRGYGIAVDSAGNVHTTGWFEGTGNFAPWPGTYSLTSAGDRDIFVSKLDSSGNFVWAKGMGGTSEDRGWGIAVDSAGNVCTTGWFRSTADFDPGTGAYNIASAGDGDIFVSKLDSNGNFVWAGGMGGDHMYDSGEAIAVDGAGNVYATGYFRDMADFDPGGDTYYLDSAGQYDMFVLKLDGWIDTDGDGLPDDWEMDNDLDPNDDTGDNGADGDPDGDGYDNLEEYDGGSDPLDEDSVPLAAAFSASATSGNRPLAVGFTDESTGTVTSWEWDFGDGYTSTAQNPSHTYYFMGDFTVTLTVTSPGSVDSTTAVIHVDEALPAEGLTYRAFIDGIKVVYSQPTCSAAYNDLQDNLLIAVWGDEPGVLKVIAQEDAPLYWDDRCDVVIDAPDTYIKKVIARGIPDLLDLYVCGQVGYVKNFILKDGYVGDTLHYGEELGLGSDAMDPVKKVLIKRGAATAPVLGVSYPNTSFNPARLQHALTSVQLPVDYEDDDVDDEDVKLAELAFAEVEARVETKAAYVADRDGIKVSYTEPGCMAYYNGDDGTLTIQITESGGDLLVKCGDEAYLVWGDYCDVYIDAPDASVNAMILKGNLETQLHVAGSVDYVDYFKLKYGSVGDTEFYGPGIGLYTTSLTPPNKILIKWGWATAPLLGTSQ